MWRGGAPYRLYLPQMLKQRRGDVADPGSTASFQARAIYFYVRGHQSIRSSVCRRTREEVKPYGVPRFAALCPGSPNGNFHEVAGQSGCGGEKESGNGGIRWRASGCRRWPPETLCDFWDRKYLGAHSQRLVPRA